MPIFSGDDKIIKIMDHADNVIVDLTKYTGTIACEAPFAFESNGDNLTDYVIYGNTGGVGDLNSVTGKYDIPITIKQGATDSQTFVISIDTPLGAGDSVSLEDVETDIELSEGMNVLLVDTMVQPELVVAKGYVEYLSSLKTGDLHTVSYYNQDGTVLIGQEYVSHGKNAVAGHQPTKADTAQYTYSFVGWASSINQTSATSGVLNNITQNKNVYAAFSETIRTFTVYFYNGSTLLQTVNDVPYGGTATYTGETPTPSQGEAVFNGWTPNNTNITADTSCYAQFKRDGEIVDDWATISAHSEAGDAENYYAIGDCKAVHVEGTMGTESLNTDLYVYILGFNHNSTLEGNGITFGGFKTDVKGEDVALCDANYDSNDTTGLKWFNMNHYQGISQFGLSEFGHNYGGWKGCDMRYDILGSTDTAPSEYGSQATTSNVGYDASSTCATSPVANTLMSCLPSDLRAVMKPMTKYTDNVGSISNVSGNVTASVDYLPLLSEFEIFGTISRANQYEQNSQAQYAYYANSSNSKVKYQHSSTSFSVFWWERSPCNDNRYNFCAVFENGAAVSFGSRNSYGVAPAFLV